MQRERSVPSRRRSIVSLLIAASLALVAAPASADPPGSDAPREARAAQEAGEAGGEAGEAVDGIRIAEMTLARGVERGTPVDPTTTFRAADGRVYVLIQLENGTGAETEIRVTFERADREVSAGGAGGVVLAVPARPRSRTVARTGTRAPGRYRVVVRSAEGNVLGTAEYEITA